MMSRLCRKLIPSFVAAWTLLCGGVSTAVVSAEDPKPREERLAEYLSGTQFVGSFTIDGMETPPKQEKYTIISCQKLPTEDLYRFVAEIKYGQVDQKVPMDLKVLWSGNTPVITLDSLWIPSMGTFDARVLIRPGKEAGRYAGTWQHGDKGGHLFGKIVPLPKDQLEAAEAKPEQAE
jgi:hypothetical protein